MKKTWLSVFLSLIFPGFGHLYVGNIKKGLVFAALNIVLLFLSFNIFGILAFFANWIISILDAVKQTKIKNEILGLKAS